MAALENARVAGNQLKLERGGAREGMEQAQLGLRQSRHGFGCYKVKVAYED